VGVNVALASNGGVASASSTISSGFLPENANNGDRTGAGWGTSGGWNDGTSATFDDWLEVDFNATYSIGEIDVFGIQDAYASPSTPTLVMTSSFYGLKDFDVQYWNGAAWTTVTGGTITGNNKVWKQFTFTPVSTTKVRVLIHATQDGVWSRVIELEAWTAAAAPVTPNSPSPANGATGQSLFQTLAWSALGATTYDVKFGTSATPGTVSSGQSLASYVPGTLTASTTYFWQIVAINGTGSTTGPIWSFTTSAAATYVKPTVLVDVELSGVNNGWTNLGQTGDRDVESSAGWVVRRGIAGGGPDDNVAQTGTFSFTLNNSAGNSARTLGYYSPYHASKRTGWGLGIRCRLRLVDPATSTARTRFVGRIDAIDPVPGSKRERAVRVTAVDWIDEAARWAITASVGEQADKSWDQVVTNILAAMPFQPTSTSLDVGAETYPYVLDASQLGSETALGEFKKLADSERGLIYVKADGTLKAEGRHARMIVSTTSWTLTESDVQSVSLPSTRAEIINAIRVTSHPKVVDTEATTLVYTLAAPMLVPAGQTVTYTAPYRDPTTGEFIGSTAVQPQVAGVDYVANGSSDGSGASMTSDFTVTVTAIGSGAQFSVANANVAAGYLTVNRLFAKGIYDRGTVTSEARDAISVATNGENAVGFDMTYQPNVNVGQAAANYYLSKYGTASAQARSVTVFGKSATLLTQILQREISDRIMLSETVTGLSDLSFINGEELRGMPSGHVSVTYTLAPAADPFAGLYWVLGVNTLGVDTLLAPL